MKPSRQKPTQPTQEPEQFNLHTFYPLNRLYAYLSLYGKYMPFYYDRFPFLHSIYKI